MMSKLDFVADQLRTSTPGVEWVIEGIDRAVELARILVRADITDLWALKLRTGSEVISLPVTYEHPTADQQIMIPAHDETVTGYCFDYYGRQIGFLGTPDRQDNRGLLESTDIGYLIAWSAAGHGQVGYTVYPDAERKVIVLRPVWRSSSDAAFIRQAIIMLISMYVMAGYGFGAAGATGSTVGSTVGQAVVSAEFAAAYPGLTAAIGNTAVSAVLNGGDVIGAVQQVALGYIGGSAGAYAGQAVMTATDSVIVSQLANAAARAVVTGADLKQAVAMQMLNLGATLTDTKMPDYEFDFSAPDAFNNVDLPLFEFDGGGFTFDVPTFDVLLPDLPPLEIADVTFDPRIYETTSDPFEWSPFSSNSLTTTFPTAANDGTVSSNPVTPAPPNSPAYSPTQIIQGISSAALASINLIKAYQSLSTPVVQTTARAVRSDGSVAVVGNNGLIQTRTPGGAVSGARPPVGIPQATLDGNYIVNNGDGTYTVVSPDGRTAHYSYSSETTTRFLGLTDNQLMLGAGALFAVALLARKR